MKHYLITVAIVLVVLYVVYHVAPVKSFIVGA